MTRSYHQSDIGLRERHCGHALILKQNGTPRDRNVFQVGVASHAILEAFGKATNENPNITIEDIKKIADETAIELSTEGRAYDKVPEPPMTIKQALEGKELAIKHWVYNPLPPDALYELPLAYDENWSQVDYYDETAIFRTMLDMVQIYDETDEEGDTIKTILVRDYKSSWHIDTDQLDNMQRRAQAVCIWLAYPDVDVIKLNVFGLRTGKQVTREINVHAEGELLKQWHEDIIVGLNALSLPQTPSPGANCINCPYAERCEHAAHTSKQNTSIVERYIASLAIAKALEPQVKKITKEANVKTNGGYVGYIKKTRASTNKTAINNLYQTWIDNNGDIEGYLSMLSISATVAKKIIKALGKQGLDIDTLTEEAIKESSYSQFGVHKE